ncbi:MAG: CDGSH iron-sulfur domain-containing protein [Legionella sp.]|jgi:CDGSH-type Zn-finger protein
MVDKADDTELDMPAVLSVEKGHTYYWCSCGHSKTQPLCDKSTCGVKALAFVADLTEEVYFCNCKLTKNPPWCDGSHAAVLLERVKKRQQT